MDSDSQFATEKDWDAAIALAQASQLFNVIAPLEAVFPQVQQIKPGAPVQDLLGRGFARVDRTEHLARAAQVVKAGRQSAAVLANRWRGKTLIIVGGSPDLEENFSDLALSIQRRRQDVCVMALNKTHDWLIEGKRQFGSRKKWIRHPIVPEFAMMLDPKPWCANYMTPHPKPIYLFGSGVDQTVWAKFDLYPTSRTFWFYPMYDREGEEAPGSSDADEVILQNNLNTIAILAGGSNVGLRALNMAMMLGFETVELWGFGSCYAPGTVVTAKGVFEEGKLYAYDKPHIEHNARAFDIKCKSDGSKLFVIANESMQRQVVQFAGVIKEIEDFGVGPAPAIDRMNVWKAWVNGEAQHNGIIRPLKIRVAGDGAIPWMAWKDGGPDRAMEHMFPHKMEAKYRQSRHWDFTKDQEMVKTMVA